jgi:hypothetical protein
MFPVRYEINFQTAGAIYMNFIKVPIIPDLPYVM